MNIKKIVILLISCLLLCGCTTKDSSPTVSINPEKDTSVSVNNGYNPIEELEPEPVQDNFENKELCCGITADVPKGLSEHSISGYGLWVFDNGETTEDYTQIIIQVDELLYEEGFDPTPLETETPESWGYVYEDTTDGHNMKQTIEEFTTDDTYAGHQCLQFVITVTTNEPSKPDECYDRLINSLDFSNFYLDAPKYE